MIQKSYDQVIVGGGFAGTAIAYQLARRGSKVLLIEAKSLLSGTSGACAGRVQLIESETEDYLKLVWEGYKRVKKLNEELDYDLEWNDPGHLTLLRTQQEWESYKNLVERLKKNDIPAYMMDLDLLRKEEPTLKHRNLIGAAYSCEGHVNPFKYCFCFTRATMKYGGEFMTFSPLIGMEKKGDKLDAVITPHGRYSANSFIIATGAWTSIVMSLVNLKFPMQFTHAEALVSEPVQKMLHHHIGLPGFYEIVHVQDDQIIEGNTRNVTLGVGQHENGSILISNAIEQGEEINQNSTSWGMPAVGHAFLEYLPNLTNIHIVRTWAAPSPFMPDYLPAIGKLPQFENLFVAAGFHLSIPTIPILCDDLAKLILDNENSHYLRWFDPTRFFNK